MANEENPKVQEGIRAAMANAEAALNDQYKSAAVPGTEPKPVPVATTLGGKEAPDYSNPLNHQHPYYKLYRILRYAFDQSATGKGRERHAASPVGDRPWLEQPIITLNRMVGPAGASYQVMKKAQEAMGMVERGDFNAGMAEMLGCIVYAAAAYQVMEEMRDNGQYKLPI